MRQVKGSNPTQLVPYPVGEILRPSQTMIKPKLEADLEAPAQTREYCLLTDFGKRPFNLPAAVHEPTDRQTLIVHVMVCILFGKFA